MTFGDGNEGGLVSLITADGNGQRIKVAYSTDEGKLGKNKMKLQHRSKDPSKNFPEILKFLDGK